MKRLKVSFMITILTVLLIYSINSGYINIGKETKAYTTRDTVFSSGMDLYFHSKVNYKIYDYILFDLSPYENHGEPKGFSVQEPLVWGKYGKALEFDGSNDYVEIDDDDSLDITDEITIMAWVNINDYSANRSIICEKITDKYELWITTLGKSCFILTLTNGGVTITVGNTILEKNTWHHLAVTFDGTLISIYLNGELDKNVTVSEDTITTSGNPLYIGYHGAGGAGYYFNGTIDEVRLYPIALTQSQIYYDMVTPLNKYPRVHLVQSRNTPTGWQEGTISDHTGFVNNDPELPFITTNATNNDIAISTWRYIVGFQAYRFYCTLYDSIVHTNPALRAGEVNWLWRFFRNGIFESYYTLQIRSDSIHSSGTSWRIVMSDHTAELKVFYCNYTSYEEHYFPIIVDAWIGDDNRHFTIRVTVDNATLDADNSFSWSFSLKDSSGTPRILDYFDGYVLQEIEVTGNNYSAQMVIASHKAIFVVWALILVGTIIASYIGYEYVVAPVLQETTGIPLPSVMEPGATVQNATTLWAAIAHELGSIFYSVGKSIVDALSPIVTAIANVAGPIIQGFINFMGDILEALINIATSLWGIIVAAIDALLYAIFPGLGAAAFSTFLTAIVDFLVGLFSWIVSSLTNLVTFLTSTFSFFGEVLGKMFNTLSTAVGYWVTMIQNIWSMLEGGLGTGFNIWETLDLATWIVIIAILYPIYLFGMWETQGIDAVLNHLNMIANIFTWIFHILLTVVQSFITVATTIIEALPGE